MVVLEGVSGEQLGNHSARSQHLVLGLCLHHGVDHARQSLGQCRQNLGVSEEGKRQALQLGAVRALGLLLLLSSRGSSSSLTRGLRRSRDLELRNGDLRRLLGGRDDDTQGLLGRGSILDGLLQLALGGDGDEFSLRVIVLEREVGASRGEQASDGGLEVRKRGGHGQAADVAIEDSLEGNRCHGFE